MPLKIKSFRTALFLTMSLSVLIPLILLSIITSSLINAKIDSLLEQDLLRYHAETEVIYNNKLNSLLDAGIVLSKNPQFVESISSGKADSARLLLQNLLEIQGVDIATVANASGIVIVRANNGNIGDSLELNGLVEYAMMSGIPAASTEIISPAELARESEVLAASAKIRRIPTLFSVQDGTSYQESGMVLVAVIPIMDDETPRGAIVLANLLNRDFEIPDKVKDTASIESTIYQHDVAISTTAKTQKDNRYVGTLLAGDVVKRTLMDGDIFLGRVWSVSAWGRASYKPIQNFRGEVVGATSVWVQEDDFRSSAFFFRQREISQIIIIITAFMASAILVSSLILARGLSKPIREFIKSAEELGKGNLYQGAKVDSYEEINTLAKIYNMKIRDLRKLMKQESPPKKPK